MEKTLVAVFESNTEAKMAQDQLRRAGFMNTELKAQSTSSGGAAASSNSTEDEGFLAWLRSLFGIDVDEAEASQYSEALRRGNCMLTVRVQDDEKAQQATNILDDCNAIDVDERAAQWRKEGWTGLAAELGVSPPRGTTSTPAASQEAPQKLSVVQEELRVGKRTVGRGGVRVYTTVTERPVEETVRLKEESVHVERKPVDRPATEADFAAMKDSSIELRETKEEAVVSKVARVKEEIEIGKTVTDREEVVRDKVRSSDVRVEELREKEEAPMASESKPRKPPKKPM